MCLGCTELNAMCMCLDRSNGRVGDSKMINWRLRAVERDLERALPTHELIRANYMSHSFYKPLFPAQHNHNGMLPMPSLLLLARNTSVLHRASRTCNQASPHKAMARKVAILQIDMKTSAVRQFLTLCPHAAPIQPTTGSPRIRVKDGLIFAKAPILLQLNSVR
jgi:hypothetical protein